MQKAGKNDAVSSRCRVGTAPAEQHHCACHGRHRAHQAKPDQSCTPITCLSQGNTPISTACQSIWRSPCQISHQSRGESRSETNTKLVQRVVQLVPPQFDSPSSPLSVIRPSLSGGSTGTGALTPLRVSHSKRVSVILSLSVRISVLAQLGVLRSSPANCLERHIARRLQIVDSIANC